MNERIQQLAEQAGFYYTDKTGFITPAGCDPGKFAELIVRECLNVINQPNGVGDDDVIRISDDVKRHFGVEE
jgi:hypothetical protein